METDDYFAQSVAHVIDVTTCTILALGYTLAAILIFTLQHGYINLFMPANSTPEEIEAFEERIVQHSL